MAGASGLSGTAVATATAGAVLVYAGLRGVNPIAAIRDVAGGHPPAVVGTPTVIGPAAGGATTAAGTPSTIAAGLTSGGRRTAGAVSTASAYAGDVYSQARRREPGYSDCSAFVDKALVAAGVPPPVPWATSAQFLISPQWKTIPAAQAMPGDIAVRAGHMVLVTGAGGASGIGQERTGVNVRTGTVSSLMGPGGFVYRMYVGKGSVLSA